MSRCKLTKNSLVKLSWYCLGSLLTCLGRCCHMCELRSARECCSKLMRKEGVEIFLARCTIPKLQRELEQNITKWCGSAHSISITWLKFMKMLCVKFNMHITYLLKNTSSHGMVLKSFNDVPGPRNEISSWNSSAGASAWGHGFQCVVTRKRVKWVQWLWRYGA